MCEILNFDRHSELSKISTLWEAWLSALGAGDARSLDRLVAEDVVVVHGDGRCLSGKEEVKDELAREPGGVRLEQKVASAEIVIRDKWAIQIGEMERTQAGTKADKKIRSHFRLVVVFARQPDATWRIGRIIELPD